MNKFNHQDLELVKYRNHTTQAKINKKNQHDISKIINQSDENHKKKTKINILTMTMIFNNTHFKYPFDGYSRYSLCEICNQNIYRNAEIVCFTCKNIIIKNSNRIKYSIIQSCFYLKYLLLDKYLQDLYPSILIYYLYNLKIDENEIY